MASQLFAKKPLHILLEEMKGEHRLRRVLGPVTLTALGIGAVIGAGIFVATGKAANDTAGPALMVSYLIAGVTCIFAALCYAEFASMAPVAGSAYTYAYTTMGELLAWIIGWDLVLEYAVGAATVANGWSGYFQSVLLKLGLVLPVALSGAPHKYDQGHILPNVIAVHHDVPVTQKVMDDKEAWWTDRAVKPAEGVYWVQKDSRPVVIGAVGDPAAETEVESLRGQKVQVAKQHLYEKAAWWSNGAVKPADGDYWVLPKTVVVGRVGDEAVEAGIQNHERAVFNLPAVLVVFVVTVVLVKGIQESAGFNALMVAIKVAAVLFVIGVGAYFIKPENWTNNFAPYGWTGISFFGIPVAGETNKGGEPVGVLAGAAIIFFAYIGFDSVSTHAEEARNPQKDVPIGIVASLLVCTILYIAVVAVLTGMVPYLELNKDAGVSDAFKRVGLGWAEFIIAMAGVAGITSVLLVMMLSAPRVFLAMARDGLVSRRIFASVHPTFRTPWISTILIGIFVAAMTAFLPIDALLHLTNIGTLFAFAIVCAAVLIMRRTNPDANRPFRCPFVPAVPILGIGACLLLMLSLPAENWYRLIVWLLVGLVIYFVYGRHHSILGMELRGEISTHGVSPAGMIDGSLKQ
jgi:amino acid transporter